MRHHSAIAALLVAALSLYMVRLSGGGTLVLAAGAALRSLVLGSSRSEQSAPASTVSGTSWLNRETTVTFCGRVCTVVWDGDPDSQFAPQEKTATNALSEYVIECRQTW